MVNDEFSAIVHGEYRRRALQEAVAQHATTPRYPIGIGTRCAKAPLALMNRSIGQIPRAAPDTKS